MTYGLENYADAAVYHCVDLLGKFPGVDEKLISQAERRLASEGVEAIASSPVVAEHLATQGFRDITLWENVADTEAFIDASKPAGDRQAGTAIFAGNLSPKKIDYGLLTRLARSGVRVVMAGPRAQGGGDDHAAFGRLIDGGVEYLGALSLSELAEVLGGHTVGIIPYLSNPYTMGVSPLKTYEYLASGLSVVSTPIPAVREVPPHVYVAHTQDGFISRVRELTRRPPTAAEIIDRQSIATLHSWAGRGNELRTKLDSLGSG